MPKHITLVWSCDLNNCIYNATYDQLKWQGHEYAIIHANQLLIDYYHQVTEKLNPQTKTMIIGSNRQDHRSDSKHVQMQRSAWGHEAIETLATELQADVDKFLLADLFNERSPGSAYELTKAHKNDSTINHPRCIYKDKEKLFLLYAQIHKIANNYNNSSVHFYFFDDSQHIVNSLGTFYSEYPHYVPSNISLNIHQYPDKRTYHATKPSKVAYIKGQGLIDPHYPTTIKTLAMLISHVMPFKQSKKISFFSKGEPYSLNQQSVAHYLEGSRRLSAGDLNNSQSQLLQLTNQIGQYIAEDYRHLEQSLISQATNRYNTIRQHIIRYLGSEQSQPLEQAIQVIDQAQKQDIVSEHHPINRCYDQLKKMITNLRNLHTHLSPHGGSNLKP